MSTALQIAASAYSQANQDQSLSSFSMTDFPYNIALDLLNTVIQEMNRLGRYWFTESSTVLAYSPGVYQYGFNSLAIDPKGILRIRKEAPNIGNELTEMNYRTFQQQYRRASIPTQEPWHWSKFNGMIVLDTIPDQDYALTVYYLRDMPPVVSETDTLLCQVTDEDVFRDGVYAYLLNRLGRADWSTAYQAFKMKANTLLADMKKDVGMPRQMPAGF
jgi:hypothetical protein